MLRRVDQLKVGDEIELRGYVVRITDLKPPSPDRFGRPMIRLEGEILSGPDRIGDTGELTFGYEGVVKRLEILPQPPVPNGFPFAGMDVNEWN